MNDLIASNSNFSRMPEGHLWGSTQINMHSVYFTELQSLGDGEKIFKMEVQGQPVGTATLKYAFGINERKDMVDSNNPIGTIECKFTHKVFGGSPKEPRAQVFNMFSRHATTSGKVVQCMRNPRRPSVETEDAY